MVTIFFSLGFIISFIFKSKAQQSGDLRLVNPDANVIGDDPHYGVVQVYNEGEWGTICDDSIIPRVGNPANSDNVFTVICRQLGYDNFDFGCSYGGSGEELCSWDIGDRTSLPILLRLVTCNGDEERLTSVAGGAATPTTCGNDGWGSPGCTHNEDIGVQCSGYPVPSTTVNTVTTPESDSDESEESSDESSDESVERANAEAGLRKDDFWQDLDKTNVVDEKLKDGDNNYMLRFSKQLLVNLYGLMAFCLLSIGCLFLICLRKE